MLTWEDTQLSGVTAIVEKLTVSWGWIYFTPDLTAYMLRKSLPFQKVTHNISKIDAQPSSLSQASLIVLVIGQLMVRLISQIFRSSLHLGCYRWTMVNTHFNSVRYSTWFRTVAATMCEWLCTCVIIWSSALDRLNDIFRLNLGWSCLGSLTAIVDASLPEYELVLIVTCMFVRGVCCS